MKDLPCGPVPRAQTGTAWTSVHTATFAAISRKPSKPPDCTWDFITRSMSGIIPFTAAM